MCKQKVNRSYLTFVMNSLSQKLPELRSLELSCSEEREDFNSELKDSSSVFSHVVL